MKEFNNIVLGLTLLGGLISAGCEVSNKNSMPNQMWVEKEPDGHIASQFVHGNNRFTVKHPPGYSLELVNAELDGPRVISFHQDTMIIGSRSGNLYRLDPPYGQASTLAELNNYPHSAVVKAGDLYVAQTNGVYRTAWPGKSGSIPRNDFERVVALPGGLGHNSRTIKMSQKGDLYVSLGIQGNCSDQYLGSGYPKDDRRGGVFKLIPRGDRLTLEPYASGLRNPVGFDWHPHTGIMYASNNGPDHLGFNQPPEYFSRIEPGSFHGMPWFQFNGDELIRDDCVDSDPPRPREQVSVPVATLPPRSAPLDMAFVPDHSNDPNLVGDALIAVHGSWGTADDGSSSGDPASRRPPRLARVVFDDGRAIRVEDLLTGFQLPDGSRWVRPAGVAVAPDGDIYFTSDSGINGLFRLTASR